MGWHQVEIVTSSQPFRGAKNKVWSWQRLALVAGLLLALVAYQALRPTLAQRLGVPLPDLLDVLSDERQSSPVPQGGADAGGAQSGGAQSGGAQSGGAQSERLFPPENPGRQTWTSAGGLRYTMGPGGEHRIDHVLRHAVDDPQRPVHSVFQGDRYQIFTIIDEAYAIARDAPSRVDVTEEDGRQIWTVDMQRRVGYEGGTKGKRANFPALQRIRLILQDENSVVTAYPCR